MKIDIFCHVFPETAFARWFAAAPDLKDMGKRVRNVQMLYDLDLRFRIMDQFGEYRQIISMASPPLEVFAGPDATPELARIANDSMAALVQLYPERFPAFVACLPMNNPAESEIELHRAVRDLGARGVQIFSNVNGLPLDREEFRFLFRVMSAYDLPIWLHPARGANFPDYLSEDRSLYEIWWTFGWPYETSVAMARLVFAGVFDQWPGIKIITHHMGAMAPYFEGRIGHGWDQLGTRTTDTDYRTFRQSMKMRPIEYFKKFFADTAVFGAAAATRCGLSFFGVDQVLFASDTPFEPEPGMYIRETIDLLDQLEIANEDRERIYWKNAQQLLRLDLR
ncbi:MAG TPA: amidohydrolase family protein [Bryobacteraceae bacterium]|nr:amidohydrolase family protein [Bryobacteraceae bacterium]